MRTISLAIGSIVLMAGCTVRPYSHVRHVDHYHDRPVEVRETHYYTRIIYINRVPYYVDEDRRAYPVPSHLRHQYKYSPNVHRAPPAFGRDTGQRDGYQLSRIIYINNIPYHVENDHSARQLPRRLHDRFRYAPVPQAEGRREHPSRIQDNRHGSTNVTPHQRPEVDNTRHERRHDDDQRRGGQYREQPMTPGYRLSRPPEHRQPALANERQQPVPANERQQRYEREEPHNRHQDRTREVPQARNSRNQETYDGHSNGKQPVKEKRQSRNNGHDGEEMDDRESGRTKRNWKE